VTWKDLMMVVSKDSILLLLTMKSVHNTLFSSIGVTFYPLSSIQGARIMKTLNNNNNNRKIPMLNNTYLATTAATIFTLTIIFASTTISPVSASTTGDTSAATPSSGIELSPQPVYQRQPSTSGVTPINQTHIGSTFSANGTLTLPNTTETINTTSSGGSLTSLTTQSAMGTETITTEDGETVIATFYEILEFPPGAGGANGITIAVLHTNSTGRLAPLNGTLLVGTDYLYPISEGFGTFWEWIPTPPPPPLLPTTMEEESPPPSPMNTTATTTDTTTTAADTNATAVASEEGGVEEQQQQTTPTIPAPNPLFE
jgi:hypothetical protein